MDSQEPAEDRLKREKMPVPSGKRPFKVSISFLLTILILALLGYQWFAARTPAPKEIPYSEFKIALTGGQVSSVLVGVTSINGKMRDGSAFTTVRVEDLDLTQTLEAQKVEIRGQEESSSGGILGFL